MRKIKILPKKPSKLIRLALKDLKAAEKVGAIIDMGYWLTKGYGNGTVERCVVCLGGAVMKGTLQLRPRKGDKYGHGKELSPNEENTPGNVDQLHALNEFRMGAVASALQTLNISERRLRKLPENLYTDDFKVEGHSSDPIQFYADMRRMARRLAYYRL